MDYDTSYLKYSERSRNNLLRFKEEKARAKIIANFLQFTLSTSFIAIIFAWFNLT